MPIPSDMSLGLRHGERGLCAEGAACCANRRMEWGFERWLQQAGKLICSLCGRLPGPDYCYPGQLDTRMEDDDAKTGLPDNLASRAACPDNSTNGRLPS